MSPQQQQWLDCAKRLGELQRSPDCTEHCREVLLPSRRSRWLSIYGNCTNGEVFVEVSDDQTTRVQSFISRHKNCPPEVRRQELPLVDTADAFALARILCRRWPRPVQEPSRRELR